MMITRLSSSLLTNLAICAALSACMPVENVRNQIATGATLTRTAVNPTAPARQPVQAAWWQYFNDPLLTALIQEALQANPDLKTAQANLRSARAQRVIAGATLLPSVSASGSAKRNSGSDSYNASMDASWELDIFGANRLAASAAGADVQAAQANVEDAKASLAAEVASNYVNLRLAQTRLGVFRQSLASRAETVRLTQLKQTAGLASSLDVEQAQLSLTQTQAQVPDLEKTVVQTQHALAILTGKEPQALQTRLASSRGIPTSVKPITLPANAIRQRPDMRAAEYKVQAATLRVGEAKANLYPSFNLGGSLGINSLSVGDLIDPSSIARSLLASISAPLFNGGKLKQQVEVSDAAREQAVANYQKTLLSALQDVANALVALDAYRQQLPLLNTAVATARSAEKLATLSYEAGTADFQNVLDAQRSVLSAQDSLLSAQANNTQALISLYKAIGGAW